MTTNLRDIWSHVPDWLKFAGDALSLTALLGSIVSMLPAVATIMTIVWTGIRIYETATVQAWLAKRKG